MGDGLDFHLDVSLDLDMVGRVSSDYSVNKSLLVDGL